MESKDIGWLVKTALRIKEPGYENNLSSQYKITNRVTYRKKHYKARLETVPEVLYFNSITVYSS